MKSCVVVLSIWLGFAVSLSAQPISGKTYNRCGTMQADSMLRVSDPTLGSLDDFENWLQEHIRKGENHSNRSVVKIIPVIVHVVHDGEAVGTGSNISRAQVESQIEVLNEDFRKEFGTPGYNNDPVGADVEVEFCLAAVDPQGNTLAVPGIDRINRNTAGYNAPPYSINYADNTIKPDSYWDPDRYMNIWTMDLSGDLLGFAQFPNASGLGDLGAFNGGAQTDGVVLWYRAFGRTGNVASPYNQGRSCTHEVGHWLGLRHIWGDGGCNDDDFCADTPPANESYNGCPVNPFSCSTVDMAENYMDYTDDACMNIFTQDQKIRVQTVLANASRRDFSTSNACAIPTSPPVPAFSSDRQSVCKGGSVQFFDQSSNGATAWFWSFPGGSPASSSQQNPIVSYPNTGTFAVSLTAYNANGSASTSQNGFISVGNAGPSIFFLENFEGGLGNWQVSNPDNDITWEVTTVQGTNTGSKAARVHLYDYISTGQRDRLISPLLDLAGKSSVTLQFDHAHRRFSSNEQDSLLVFASTDGGNTYPYRLFAQAENGNGNFATNSILSSDFVPAAAEDWCFMGATGTSCFSLDLSLFDGETQFRLAFESYNDYGNNIFIDNVELSAICSDATAIDETLSLPASLGVFPNPSHGHFTVMIESEKTLSGTLEIIDLRGQVLHVQTFAQNQRETMLEVRLAAVSTGSYLLRIRTGAGTQYQKILIW